MHAQAKARERAIAAADKACTRYGIFPWSGDNRGYLASNAVGGKLFGSRVVADKAVKRQDPDMAKNYVVRSVGVCTSAERDALIAKKLG